VTPRGVSLQARTIVQAPESEFAQLHTTQNWSLQQRLERELLSTLKEIESKTSHVSSQNSGATLALPGLSLSRDIGVLAETGRHVTFLQELSRPAGSQPSLAQPSAELGTIDKRHAVRESVNELKMPSEPVVLTTVSPLPTVPSPILSERGALTGRVNWSTTSRPVQHSEDWSPPMSSGRHEDRNKELVALRDAWKRSFSSHLSRLR